MKNLYLLIELCMEMLLDLTKLQVVMDSFTNWLLETQIEN